MTLKNHTNWVSFVFLACIFTCNQADAQSFSKSPHEFLKFSPFEIFGKSISITEIPRFTGRWFVSSDPDGLPLRIEGRTATLYGDGKRCIQDRREVIRAYRDGDVITIETGGNSNQTCPNMHGMFYRINLSSKEGAFGVKAGDASNQVFHIGRISLD